MQENLCLRTLGDLDSGSAGLIIDAAIAEGLRDLDDRGKDGKPREVVIKLSMTMLDNGQIACHLDAHAKAPPRKTATTFGLVRQSQGRAEMLFQTMAPEDPHQRTIDEAEGRERGQG